MLVEYVTELLLPTSVYVVVLISLLSAYAFYRRGSPLGRARYVLLLLLSWAYCLSTPALGNALLSSLERDVDTAPPSPTGADPLILVLGCGSTPQGAAGYEVRLGAAGWERTWAGIRLWKRIGGRLLFAGGPTPDGRSSVAERMAEIARASGVPTSSVLAETRSRTTYENFLFNRARLRGEEAWLVTSALHMRRALAVARKLGLKVHPVPCDHRAIPVRRLHWYAWIPDGEGPAMFADALHELIGLVYYRWKGYAS